MCAKDDRSTGIDLRKNPIERRITVPGKSVVFKKVLSVRERLEDTDSIEKFAK